MKIPHVFHHYSWGNPSVGVWGLSGWRQWILRYCRWIEDGIKRTHCIKVPPGGFNLQSVAHSKEYAHTVKKLTRRIFCLVIWQLWPTARHKDEGAGASEIQSREGPLLFNHKIYNFWVYILVDMRKLPYSKEIVKRRHYKLQSVKSLAHLWPNTVWPCSSVPFKNFWITTS